MKYTYKSKKSLVVMISVYLIVFAIMSLTRFFTFIQLKMFDRDGYLSHILRFENQSFYDEIAYGTSVVFNTFIYFINLFCNNLDSTFRILNIISIVLLGFLGGVIILKNRDEHKWLTFLFIPLFMLFWLNDEQVQWTNNDIFLSVIVLLIYLHLFTSYKLGNKALNLGVLFALLFSTRLEFSLVLFPSFILCLIVFYINKLIKVKNIFIFGVIFIITMLLLNWPSIIENGKLSSYVKGGDYGSFNTVGTLRMFDENKVQIIRKEIYLESTSDEYVKDYIEKQHIDDLPNNVFEFMVRYPIYYLKLFALNIINVFLFLFRRYTFLLIFPVLLFFQNFKKQKIKIFWNIEQLPFFMFLTSCFFLFFVLHTVVEYRWLDTIEFLLLFSIYKSMQQLYKMKYKIRMLNILLFTSLGLLIIFNLRTLINIIY